MRDYKETIGLLRGLAVSLQAIDSDYAQLCDDAADVIEELDIIVEGYRSRMRLGSGWISVGERLPETGKVVLLCINCEKSRPHTGFLTADGGFMHDVLGDMSRSKWKVTHWMPLPSAPKEDAE